MAARKPNILWAQRTDKVFLTVDVQEAVKPQVKVENAESGNGRVTFKGTGKSHATGTETHEYELDLELNGAIDPEQSKISATARHVVLLIAKKPGGEGYWPRLCKDSAKQPNIKVDWDKWVDEDEEAEEGLDPSSQFDLSSLSDFSNFQGGAPGLGGEEEDEDDNSDDEDLPELEKA